MLQKLTYRQLYEQARTRMTRDALTGLYNRGYFDEALPRAVAHAERYQHPLSVLLVDTDHFKEINDTHSHLVGDRVLKLVAELLAEHARAADTVCRYGGDEFVVILSSADAASAAAFAERFRRRLRDRARWRCRAARCTSPPRSASPRSSRIRWRARPKICCAWPTIASTWANAPDATRWCGATPP